LCRRKSNKRAVNSVFIFTASQEVLMSTDTQFNDAWKRNSKALKNSGCTFCLTCKLLNSPTHFLFSVGRRRYWNFTPDSNPGSRIIF
jgi:hypothetical protein